MPVVIRKVVGDYFENHTQIASGEWRIREQVEALEAWFDVESNALDTQHQWIADIGFAGRSDARGGGPPITKNLMQKCLAYNLEIYLSEYPRHREKSPSSSSAELREQILNCKLPNSSAILAGEGLILSGVEDDLDVFSDEPEHEIYVMALLQKEIIESLDDKNKRLCILFFLRDIMLGSDKDISKYAESLYDKILKNID